MGWRNSLDTLRFNNTDAASDDVCATLYKLQYKRTTVIRSLSVLALRNGLCFIIAYRFWSALGATIWQMCQMSGLLSDAFHRS
jgi:hypothetical protein